ncbi:hypothetical protein [Nitrososphaeria virus YSH_462411]|uniref:Uncharacterized protein n=1 Tax=Nitrososphaeria virus YSH_462411 TaxID=3071321 RepID=A0A976UAH5_9CAUD|nr:hypothetical protein QKV92_gp25 [Yangshan Harbor Nitrososphaeria virus]UVF62297.1 hypothetical protein [Nitrososphaeria virus YSH_462411]
MNKENRSMMISEYDESKHIKDYHNILARLMKEKQNYVKEPYTRTLDQIEYHIRFFEKKLLEKK